MATKQVYYWTRDSNAYKFVSEFTRLRSAHATARSILRSDRGNIRVAITGDGKPPETSNHKIVMR